MAPRLLLLPLLALLSVALTGVYVADVVSTKTHASACEMTWSWPVYSPVTWRSSPSHAKYQLFRVDMKQERTSLAGVPVLFVPGHMGSYKQARSLSRHLWDADETLFDLFALDFQEEPTGLNGNFITQQATFLNDAVRAILKEYKKQNKKKVESVVIVAHSMGGIVARTAEFLPNYKKRSIQHVVALGVPYETPPFPFDAEVNAVYDRMKMRRDEQVVYVAVAGGHKDMLVQTPFTSVDSVADPLRAFVTLASAIPTVETPVDHFCLLWCHQLLKVVAESLYKAVDLETRELVRNPNVRLAIAKETLLGGVVGEDGEIETASNVSLHRAYVQDGYYPGEYAGYTLLLPHFLTNLLRTRFMTMIVIMYALTLQIFYAQVAQWQTRFNLQSSASPQDLSQENFPSFTSMLHPAAHAPVFLKNIVAVVSNVLHGRSNLGTSTTTTVATAVLALVAAAVAGYMGYGKLLSDDKTASSLVTMVAEVAILYAYALGLLYALTHLFSVLQRFVVSPIVSILDNVTDRLKLRRWMVIIIIHGAVQLLGHINSSSSSSSKVFGLVVVAAFAVFVLYLFVLGGSNDGTSDQQRMKRSLFAVLWLSVFPWVGKIAFFASIVQWPPSELPNDLLVEGGSYIAILSACTYLISLSLDCMTPLPPTAFFGASSGQDAASIYGKSSSSNVKITAENCPKCIFEDGGPGAILEEYSDRTTRRVVAGKTGEVVYVGPTFRVVSCDCVYRFKNSRDFCDFCIRSCRLCGGGNGNFQEAAKYKDFLEESKVDLAMHALVPMAFQMCAAVQVTYGLYQAHLSFYLTPVCVLALVIYHTVLRHPIEARRIKNKQRKKTSKKKKSSSKPTSEQNSTTTTTSETTTSRNKKKKKRKSGTSSTSSASPLIEKASTSS
ncbi:hypothetical protein PRIC2_002125 [Phytophthora ramorum]